MNIKRQSARRLGTTIGVLFAVFIFIILAAISWITTCFVIRLITICFGLTFNWYIATGIWLLMLLVKSIFTRTITVKKG